MIFVTGGTGFIGAHLLTELAKGNVPVKALKRKQSTTKHTENLFNYIFGAEGKTMFQKINWVDGDIMDIYSVEEALDGVTEVYHCAAEVSLRDEDADGVIRPAQVGTENMVNASLTKGIQKFCHVSSVAALGLPANGKLIDEDCFDEFSFANSPYAIGKHLAEAEVWRAGAEGLNVAVVSPSIVLGPWTEMNKGGSMGLFVFIDKLSRFYTGGTMGYVDVKDVVAIMMLMMKENRFNERYIASSENVSFKDIYSTIAKALKKPLPTVKMNSFMLKAFALFYNIGNKNKISSTMIEHATSDHLFTNKKVVDALGGYTFAPVKDTLEQTAKFYLHAVRK